ncbi:MAG: MFS transporter [Pseudomonadota bacterium]
MPVEKLDKKTIVGMIAMAMGIFVVANDFTALSVAIPAIEKTYNVDVTTAQWVINIYTLSFSIIIITGGRLADMFGRRRMFMIGAAIFGIFSLSGGLAENIEWLLGSRCIMGIGGALMWSSVIGMTYEIVPDSRAGLAGGLIIGVAGMGNAMGPLIGGFLTDTLGWQWVFFINLPVVIIGVTTMLLVVARDKPTAPNERVDYIGTILLASGLFAWLLALDIGVDKGWTNPFILSLFIGGAFIHGAFVIFEKSVGEAALVPNSIMKNRTFAMSAISILLVTAVFFGALIYLPQFMIKNLGFNAAQSGAGLLPMMLTFAIFSFIAGRLYEALGAKLIVSAGAALLAGGAFLLSTIETHTTYVQLVPGMVILGVGVGLYFSSVTTVGVKMIDPKHASLAGAILYMMINASGAMALALNTAIVASAHIFAEGISMAFIVNGCLATAGAVLAILFIKGKSDKDDIKQ